MDFPLQQTWRLVVRELGMPFRQAHSLTGKIVEVALRKNIKLSEFSLSDLKKLSQR